MVVIVVIIVPHSSIPYQPKLRFVLCLTVSGRGPRHGRHCAAGYLSP